jgi:hypothetical protein
MATMRTYQTEFPGEQSQPVGWFGNPIDGWGSSSFKINNYKVVGYMNGQLWLDSKTGGASDSIQIDWFSDPQVVESFMIGRHFDFDGRLEYDFKAGRWFISWSNATPTKAS